MPKELNIATRPQDNASVTITIVENFAKTLDPNVVMMDTITMATTKLVKVSYLNIIVNKAILINKIFLILMNSFLQITFIPFNSNIYFPINRM